MDARAKRRRQPPGGYVVVLLLRLVAILQLALPHLITHHQKMPLLNWTAAWHPPMVYTYDAVAAFAIIRAG